MTTTPSDPLDVLDQAISDVDDAGASVRVAVSNLRQALADEQAAHKATSEAFTAYRETHPDPDPEPTPEPEFVIGAAYLSNTDPSGWETRMGVGLQTRRTYENNDAGAERQITDARAIIRANIAAGRPWSSVSAKVPVTMSSAATGGADDWAKRFGLAILTEIQGTGHRVRMGLNHEPENDVKIVRSSTGAVSNGPTLVKYREDWKVTQNRLSPFFDLAGIQYVIILMGDHQWNGGANYYPWWQMDKAMPNGGAIKGVGFDYYERYGQSGSTRWTSWSWLDKAKAWFDTHKRPDGTPYKKGLSETAWTEAAEIAHPGQAQLMAARLRTAGFDWMEYFNTNLNSAAPWLMQPGDRREKSFAELLKANQ